MAKRYDIKCPVFLEAGEMNVTSSFGYRKSPSTGKTSFHKGIDLTRWAGYSATATITAFADGKVTSIKNTIKGADHDNKANSAGNYVIIRHDNGYVTKYFHLKYNSLKVAKGDSVKAGQVIGYMGNTGNSYGAHLHFQLERGGVAIDALPYLLGKKSIKGGNIVTVELTVLRKGAKGEEVKTLQRLLNALGYDLGEVDGSFGGKTDKALRAFQKAENLSVDGVCGANTWAKLLKG